MKCKYYGYYVSLGDTILFFIEERASTLKNAIVFNGLNDNSMAYHRVMTTDTANVYILRSARGNTKKNHRIMASNQTKPTLNIRYDSHENSFTSITCVPKRSNNPRLTLNLTRSNSCAHTHTHTDRMPEQLRITRVLAIGTCVTHYILKTPFNRNARLFLTLSYLYDRHFCTMRNNVIHSTWSSWNAHAPSATPNPFGITTLSQRRSLSAECCKTT